MANYIGAIDQGTTSTRFCVFDAAGKIVAVGTKRTRADLSAAGMGGARSRGNLAVHAGSDRAGSAAGNLRAADLAAIGITNQRETTVLWNRKTGKPVANALVWQDTRVDDYVAELSREGGPDRFRAKTGLAAQHLFQQPENSLAARSCAGHPQAGRSRRSSFRQHRFFSDLAPDWWHRRRTSHHRRHQCQPHPADGSRYARRGIEDLLDAFGIPAAMLPRICSSGEAYGTVKVGAAKGVAIAGILGDQQAALVGQTCFKSGEAKNTYGTGCFLLMNTGERAVRSTCGLLTTVAYKFGNEPARLRARGQHRHHRRAGAMDARQPGPDRQPAPRSKLWPARSKTTAASISSRRSPDSTRRTGSTTPAA